MRVLSFTAKCSDCFGLNLSDGEVEIEHDGYVPDDLGIGGGDYVEMSIDADTGQILNWDKLPKFSEIDRTNW